MDCASSVKLNISVVTLFYQKRPYQSFSKGHVDWASSVILKRTHRVTVPHQSFTKGHMNWASSVISSQKDTQSVPHQSFSKGHMDWVSSVKLNISVLSLFTV